MVIISIRSLHHLLVLMRRVDLLLRSRSILAVIRRISGLLIIHRRIISSHSISIIIISILFFDFSSLIIVSFFSFVVVVSIFSFHSVFFFVFSFEFIFDTDFRSRFSQLDFLHIIQISLISLCFELFFEKFGQRVQIWERNSVEVQTIRFDFYQLVLNFQFFEYIAEY